MSETALTPPDETTATNAPEAVMLDGDAPRLGSAPLAAPAPMGGAGTPEVSSVPPAPSPPIVSPVLAAPGVPMQTGAELAAPTPAPAPEPTSGAAPATPGIPAPELPVLPASAPAVPTRVGSDDDDAPTEGDDDHPMAHLMGSKAKVSEASQRAAELRAARKAKAKRLKIGFAVGAVVVSAVVGPPLWSWFTNALNEAGGINTEEPAD